MGDKTRVRLNGCSLSVDQKLKILKFIVDEDISELEELELMEPPQTSELWIEPDPENPPEFLVETLSNDVIKNYVITDTLSKLKVKKGKIGPIEVQSYDIEDFFDEDRFPFDNANSLFAYDKIQPCSIPRG